MKLFYETSENCCAKLQHCVELTSAKTTLYGL